MLERSFLNARRSARTADEKKTKKVIVLYVGPAHARTHIPAPVAAALHRSAHALAGLAGAALHRSAHARAAFVGAALPQARVVLYSFFLFFIPSIKRQHVYYTLPALVILAKVPAWIDARPCPCRASQVTGRTDPDTFLPSFLGDPDRSSRPSRPQGGSAAPPRLPRARNQLDGSEEL